MKSFDEVLFVVREAEQSFMDNQKGKKNFRRDEMIFFIARAIWAQMQERKDEKRTS